MPIEKVDGTDLSYYLVCYDKNGREQNEDDGLMSERVCRAIQNDAVTDVFIMSHGWKGDIPAAKEQYNAWIQAMARCEADRKQIRELRKDFKPLLVGFHWPSQPWGDEEIGVGKGASFAAPGGGQADSLEGPSANTSTFTPIASRTRKRRARRSRRYSMPPPENAARQQAARTSPRPVGCWTGNQSSAGADQPRRQATTGAIRSEPGVWKRQACARATTLVRRRRTLGPARR
jgi:hypothetical protein